MNGEWKWLFRAVDKQGWTVDFLLTHRRNTKAARRFLAKALRTRQHWPPQVIYTDQNPAMVKRCGKLKRDDPDAKSIESTVRRNTSTTASRPITARSSGCCRATLGFKSMKTAYATIKGFEVMR